MMPEGMTAIQPKHIAPPEFGDGIIGLVFGRLKVLGELPGVLTGKRRVSFRVVECLCECGTVKRFRLNNIQSGKTVSCGCWRSSISSLIRTTHGHAARGGSATYRSWYQMKDRCLNQKCKRYRDYGGRGIGIHQQWVDSFEAFVRDVGERPSKDLSIHRINNDAGYFPGNVKWATRKEQASNRRPRQRLIE